MKFEHIELKDILPKDEEIDGEIDISIGTAYHCSLVTEDINIRLKDKLLAIKSKLGYEWADKLYRAETSNVTCYKLCSCNENKI